MKTSKSMQAIVERIAEKHGLDLKADEAHLHLENGPYMPLVIEKVGRNLLSIAHYFEQNGDLCADPDVVFFTGYAEWVAIEIQQVLGYQRVAWLNDDSTSIKSVSLRGQVDLASFTNLWARNLKEQDYLNRGVNPKVLTVANTTQQGGSHE
jgi:hypothetical protein